MHTIIVIPFYPSTPGQRELSLLADTVSQIYSEYVDVVVVCQPDVKVNLNVPVEIVQAPIAESAQTILERGWETAIRENASHNDMIVLDYRSGATLAKSIGDAITVLQNSEADVVLGSSRPKDHPCQFTLFYNVLESHIFIPVAEGVSVPESCRQFFPNGFELAISDPFSFNWDDWTGWDKKSLFFIVRPDIHGILPLRERMLERQLQHDAVILWRESSGVARQIGVADHHTAALPYLLHKDGVPLKVRAKNGYWVIETQGDVVQLSPLGGKKARRSFCSKMSLHTVCKRADASFASIDKITSPFLLNIYENAQLPEAEIELPYVPDIPAWSVSDDSMVRSVDGQIVYGRQAFPPVLHFDGRLLALTALASQDPQGALLHGRLGYVVHEDAGIKGRIDPLQPEEVESSICCQSVRVALNPEGDEGSVAQADEVDAIDIKAACMAFCKAVSGQFRFATVRGLLLREKVNPLGLSAKAQDIVAKRHAAWCGGTALPSLLLSLVEEISQCSGTVGLPMEERIRILAEYCTKAGLPLSWIREFARLQHTDHDPLISLAALDVLHSFNKRLVGAYTALAEDKYFHELGFHIAAILFEREEQHSGLIPSKRLKYAVALMATGKTDHAEKEVAKAYQLDSSLCNGYAMVGWVGFCSMACGPEKVMSFIDLDEKLGKLGPGFIGRKAVMAAYIKGIDAALEIVRQGYASGHVPDGGFYRVGWEYYAVIQQDPSAALPFIEMDDAEKRGNLYALYKLMSLAHTGNLIEAESLAHACSVKWKGRIGYYTFIGLVHWVSHRDTAVLKRMMVKDYQRKSSLRWQEVLLVLLARGRNWFDIESIDALMHSINITECGLKFCLRGLITCGYNQASIRDLLNGNDVLQKVLFDVPSDAVPCSFEVDDRRENGALGI